jgi:Ca2+-binding RTX toxin-like protein
LVGTPGPDVIVGLDGNDDIAAQRGDDLVCAGAGNDRIGDQPDRVFDGDLFQGSGDDDDHVFLQSANNVVAYGNRGDDTLEFPAGDGAGPSNLVLDGGAGSDRLVSFFGLESVLREARERTSCSAGTASAPTVGRGPTRFAAMTRPGSEMRCSEALATTRCVPSPVTTT